MGVYVRMAGIAASLALLGATPVTTRASRIKRRK